MPTATASRPLVPTDLTARHALLHACFAEFVSAAGGLRGGGAVAALKRLWPQDHTVALGVLERSTTTSALTSVPAWAGLLINDAVASFIGSLQPESAAAALFEQSVRLNLPANLSITVPGRASAGPASGVVAESAPIPVATMPVASGTLAPVKIATIIVLSAEVANLGTGGLPLFETLLRENAALSLDTLVFGSVAPGLLASVSALTASANARNDLARLAEAVSANGSGRVLFVASPGLAAGLVANFPEFTGSVAASAALPAGRIIAVDPLSIISATDPVPEIEASEQATLHMDSAPGAVEASVPTVDLFQTNRVGLRMLISVGVGKRRSDAAAFMNVAAGGWWPAT